MRLSLWLKELRAPFFTATIVPVVLGAVLAWHDLGLIDWTIFLVTMIAALCLHAGANMANDYFDYKSGCDLHPQYEEFTAPFFGGSRLIPDGLLEARDVHRAALLAIGSGIVLGLYIVWQVGWPILVLGLVGVFSGYLYVVHLAPRGLGEFAVLVNFGPLMVLGSYYAQTGLISGEALLVSIPVGLLIAAVLWINEVSDYEADRTAAKNTLVVRLGRRRAVNAYLALIISSYALIVLLSLLEITPLCAAISLVSLPIAIRSIRLARHHSTEPSRMVGANAGTVMIHASTGLLLALSYPICSWIQPLL